MSGTISKKNDANYETYVQSHEAIRAQGRIFPVASLMDPLPANARPAINQKVNIVATCLSRTYILSIYKYIHMYKSAFMYIHIPSTYTFRYDIDMYA